MQTEMTFDQTFQTEVTSDQTFQTKMISDQTFQTWMSSDQTEPRPWSRQKKTMIRPSRPKWPLIRPKSEHGPDYCAFEPLSRPCNFGLGTQGCALDWVWSELNLGLDQNLGLNSRLFYFNYPLKDGRVWLQPQWRRVSPGGRPQGSPSSLTSTASTFLPKLYISTEIIKLLKL